MPPKRRGPPRKAPSIVIYTSACNEKGHKQLCVYAQCALSDFRVGPIWGQGDSSVKRALGTLTQKCDCPAQFHVMREWCGKRVKVKGRE